MRSPNAFINPVNDARYEWPINHSEEDESGRDRNVTAEANSGNVGLIRQQGELTPLVFRYSGTILRQEQLVDMLGWFKLCESQTIYFEDFAGDSYEVQITSFKPKRVRAVDNLQARDTNRLHYWTYTMELHVLRVIGGVYAGFPA